MEARSEVVDGVARLTMCSGKVNAISLELIQAMTAELAEIRKLADSGKIHAVVLASERERFFSPGFHLQKLMGCGPDGIVDFADKYTDLCLALLQLPVYSVCEIGGHAIAGGMILALSCDERIGADCADARLGLNEVGIGIPLPRAAIELARARLGARAFEATMLAKSYTPREALQVGFLDRLVHPAALRAAVDERIAEYREVAGKAFRLTKPDFQRPLIESFAAARKELPAAFRRMTNDHELQGQLMAAMLRRQQEKEAR